LLVPPNIEVGGPVSLVPTVVAPMPVDEDQFAAPFKEFRPVADRTFEVPLTAAMNQHCGFAATTVSWQRPIRQRYRTEFLTTSRLEVGPLKRQTTLKSMWKETFYCY